MENSQVSLNSSRSSLSSQQSTLTNNERVKSDLNYCGCILHDIHLAQNLQEFKNQFIKAYSLEDQITDSDEILISYGEPLRGNNEVEIGAPREKTIIETDSDYQTMLRDFFQDNNKKRQIVIETKKLPVFFKGEKCFEFEDEIKQVVERELKIAGNNIKKCLTSNIKIGCNKQVRNLMCNMCKEQIIGCYYKKVSPDEDLNLCELCATKVNFPVFKIY